MIWILPYGYDTPMLKNVGERPHLLSFVLLFYLRNYFGIVDCFTSPSIQHSSQTFAWSWIWTNMLKNLYRGDNIVSCINGSVNHITSNNIKLETVDD